MSTKLWKPSSGWILGIEQIHKCSCRNWLQIPPGNSVHWRVRRGLYRNSQFGLFSPKIADISWESDLVITVPDLQQGVDQGWLKRKSGETQSRCLGQSTGGEGVPTTTRVIESPGRHSPPCSQILHTTQPGSDLSWFVFTRHLLFPKWNFKILGLT